MEWFGVVPRDKKGSHRFKDFIHSLEAMATTLGHIFLDGILLGFFFDLREFCYVKKLLSYTILSSFLC
jgi:hypothetical protein